MAKRKSINKRLSRYSHRSSAGSGFLNPNSESLEEEEPFWWNKLSNTTASHSKEYSAFNDTSKYLHADSHIQSVGGNHQWWKVLETSDSSQSEGRIEAAQQEIQNKYITSDTDEEETDLPLRKRKIQIRKKPNENISNIFKKALDDSKSLESSESNLPQNSITKHTNDTPPPSKKSLQELDHTKKQTSEIKDTSNKSTDQSDISNKILKPKHNIFRKKLKNKSYNAFENLFEANDDSDNKSEKIETSSSNSSAKLMDKKNTSKKDVLDKSKKEKSKLSSSGATVFKTSITNPETLNYNDNDLIPQNRSNSSFSLLSSSEKSSHLQLIPKLTHDHSNKSTSKNISTNQKESSIVEKIVDTTMHSTTPTKVRNSATNKIIESREIGNKNETSLASVRHINTPNKSKMEDSINLRINNSNLRKNINASQRESIDERNLTDRIIDKSAKFETISTDMASKNFTNLSNSRSTEINDIERKRMSSSLSSDIDERNLADRIIDKSAKFETISTDMASTNFTNLSNSRSTEINDIERKRMSSSLSPESNIKNNTRDRSLTKNNSMNITEKGVISPENQMHTINSDNKSWHTANVIKDISKNETLKKNISTLQKTSIHNISNKNEENLLKANNKTLVKDLDMNAVSLKQISSRIMDVVDDPDDKQNANYIDYPNREISDIINTDRQKKINEYFTSTTSKLISPINARQSKHLQSLSNTKENEKIKKKKEVAKKPKIHISKFLDTQFATEKNPSLKKKQILEKIQELRNMETNKSKTKKIIDKAYIVNGKVYKRPKLPRPQTWVTNRLYQFLWKIMKPKYELFTRVRSEKFVQELSDVVSIITKAKKYEDYETLLNNLMENMATEGIIRTANDFYDFCHNYLPYDFRVKVVPMLIPGKGRNIPYDPKTLNEPILKIMHRVK
ncbi:PREDICTED: dentin sialophosphoprotein-like isoform X1 [Polistes canadensis]|uniref:dentin sialophosphoprotein-like isoform X1 n=1 Tax=Polistes canadensis TaxID=91411 RepID=UPI000718AC13|nr:PREDICTED: dentin sialophosphoprotein-like isoform X1 [Polistes canadensis]